MKKTLFLFIFSFVSLISNASNENYWEPVMDAIIEVESNGNPYAISPSGKYVGAMQIAKIVVDDCNEYLQLKKSKKRYTYNDRYDVQKSKEMFILIQERYNKEKNIEKAVRIWNGGCNYNKKSTDKYYLKFLKFYNKRDV